MSRRRWANPGSVCFHCRTFFRRHCPGMDMQEASSAHFFGVGVMRARSSSFGRSRLSQSEIFASSPSDGSAAAGESSKAGVAAFHKDVEPLLAHYCYDCHGNGEKRGNLAFDELRKDDEIINPGLWLKVLKNLRAGIMPPKGQERPTPAQQQQIETWIKTSRICERSEKPKPGPRHFATIESH